MQRLLPITSTLENTTNNTLRRLVTARTQTNAANQARPQKHKRAGNALNTARLQYRTVDTPCSAARKGPPFPPPNSPTLWRVDRASPRAASFYCQSSNNVRDVRRPVALRVPLSCVVIAVTTSSGVFIFYKNSIRIPQPCYSPASFDIYFVSVVSLSPASNASLTRNPTLQQYNVFQLETRYSRNKHDDAFASVNPRDTACRPVCHPTAANHDKVSYAFLKRTQIGQ